MMRPLSSRSAVLLACALIASACTGGGGTSETATEPGAIPTIATSPGAAESPVPLGPTGTQPQGTGKKGGGKGGGGGTGQTGGGGGAAAGGAGVGGGTAAGGGGTGQTGGSGGGGGGGGGTGQTGGGGGGKGKGGGKGGGTGGGKQQGIASSSLPNVTLFSEEENRVGITDNQITLCTHAALVFADIFDTKISDLNVFWDWVNDNGGIYGRKVVMTYEDDAYRPDNAVQAAQRCRAKNPFFLLGGIGFDQIPAVRNWAEQNRMLYIHHIARADSSKQFSFSYQPTVEQVGAMAGQWIVEAHKGKRIGAIWRQSENWQPGYEAFKRVLDANGIQLVADLPVQQNQTVYTQQIVALQQAGAEVVFTWENALGSTEISQQSASQGYRPQWVMFPFNLTPDTLGDDALNPPMQGIATWPAYSPGMDTGPYASYAKEVREFEAHLRKYGSGARGNDILWMTWLGWKQIYQLLLDCGPDCTRNKMVALLIANTQKAVHPGCPVDFRTNGHVGGYLGSVFEAFKRPSGSAYDDPKCRDRRCSVGWREIHHCKLNAKL